MCMLEYSQLYCNWAGVKPNPVRVVSSCSKIEYITLSFDENDLSLHSVIHWEIFLA